MARQNKTKQNKTGKQSRPHALVIYFCLFWKLQKEPNCIKDVEFAPQRILQQMFKAAKCPECVNEDLRSWQGNLAGDRSTILNIKMSWLLGETESEKQLLCSEGAEARDDVLCRAVATNKPGLASVPPKQDLRSWIYFLFSQVPWMTVGLFHDSKHM